MKIICEQCGNTFDCINSRFLRAKHHFCSKECSTEFYKQERASSKEYMNCTCPICGIGFHLKESAKKKTVNPCCSMNCANEIKRLVMTGKQNHQYGLRGHKNASWKSDERISSYGYKLIRSLDHPFANSDGFVFEHRLVAEKYLLNDANSIEINGIKYLKPSYVVHHKDGCKTNNDVDNLEVMLKSEHTRTHNYLNPRDHDSLGRFI